jgi:cbb3-type cytochrome oxidase subunit 3
MRKFGIFTLTIFMCSILAGIYGIINDQITYTISTEYFTKFKYIQFGVEPFWFGGDRTTVVIIGFLATWWTGIFIGIFLGLTGLIFKDHKKMRTSIFKAIALNFCVTILTAIIGFFYGKYHLTKTGVNWWLPKDLIDKDSFIIVGSIHNFSYIGGLIGLIAGIIYLIIQSRLENGKQGNR